MHTLPLRGVPLWCAPLVFRLAPALVQAAVDAHAVGGARDRPRVSILQPALLVVHVREQTGSLFGNCCEGLVLILLHCIRKFLQRWQQLPVWPATLDLRLIYQFAELLSPSQCRYTFVELCACGVC